MAAEAAKARAWPDSRKSPGQARPSRATHATAPARISPKMRGAVPGGAPAVISSTTAGVPCWNSASPTGHRRGRRPRRASLPTPEGTRLRCTMTRRSPTW